MKMDNVLISSEQSVIGSILVDNNSFDEIDLIPEEFLTESHREIFREIALMLAAGRPVDIILLAESMERKGKLEDVGNLPYLGAIAQSCNTPSTIKSHAEIVRKAYRLRKAKALIVDLDQAIEGKTPIDELTEIAERGLYGLLDSESQHDLAHIGEAVAEAIEFEGKDKNGIKTGLRDLDYLLDGFKKSDLIIVAGRPSMGKSTLSMQIAEHVSKTEPVIIFSLEMPRRQVASRFLRYHETKISKPEAVAHLNRLQLHIVDRSALTVQQIKSQCRRVKRKHGLSMIVVDYLQLMQGTGENRNQEIGSLSRGLKGLAKEFDIPVVLLSQLSRKVEERIDKRPIMSDLRESGEIEQDADVILFIYREEVYQPDTQNKAVAEIICRKHRNGATGTAYALFDGNRSRFFNFDGEIKHSEPKKRNRGFSVV